MPYNLITILGPTAVGKTKLAAQIAYYLNGEIISADSRQVYQYLNIGTGKDYEDYIFNEKKIPYYLIDIISPEKEYNLFNYINDFNKVYEDIKKRKKYPILCGGTGLYLSAVIQGYSLNKIEEDENKIYELENLSLDVLKNKLFELNPKLHNTTDLLDKKRIIQAILIAQSKEEGAKVKNLKSLTIGLKTDLSSLRKRIENRLIQRLKNGMIEETEKLIQDGLTHEKLRFFGLEYKYLSLYLSKQLNKNDMKQKLTSAIYLFARKQLKWFRKMEREGVKIIWFEIGQTEEVINFINMKIKQEGFSFD